jgi:hypothetical protein
MFEPFRYIYEHLIVVQRSKDPVGPSIEGSREHFFQFRGLVCFVVLFGYDRA